MLNALRGSGRRAEAKRTAARLYEELSAAARQPVFFAALGVADTVDGRFDMVALHGWLVLERLTNQGQRDLAQALTDRLFIAFDEALRELGAGDMGMSRRMTKMGDAFYGRLQAYSAAKNEAALAEAIGRNVFRGAQDRGEQSRVLARYVASAREKLAKADPERDALDFGVVTTG
ncbi:MAG: ubiquinol-cytochrome C chaperone [Proteobacteria bacterium]|nr:ubiquinol-cytochrome C chaperone [Pseudomonadota bacterium]